MTYSQSNPAWDRMRKGIDQTAAEKRVGTCVTCGCRVAKNLQTGMWSACSCTRQVKETT
jgi:hypothetical protein